MTRPAMDTFFAQVLVFTCHKCGQSLECRRSPRGKKITILGTCRKCKKTWEFDVTVKEKDDK